jgi:hypothetical protein
MLIHTSIGGSELRLRFDNSYGTRPVTLRDVTVALPTSGVSSSVVPGTLRHVRFASGDSTTITVGAGVRSLPLTFAVPADAWIAVSFYAPGDYSKTTHHGTAWGLNWTTPGGGGDHAADVDGSAFIPATEWTYLSGLDVVAAQDVSTIVTLGDSITDGLSACRR